MKIYVGIDMAKHDFVCAIKSEDRFIDLVHPKLINNKRGFSKLKQWVDKQVKKHNVDFVHFGVESTGGYEIQLVKWFRIHTNF